jgi:hypothetical protein
MPIIYDTLTVIAEYIDNKTYQQGTLANSDFYIVMERFNNIKSTWNDEFDKYIKTGLYYTSNIKFVNYHSLQYLLSTKNFDIMKYDKILLYFSTNDVKLFEYLIKKIKLTEIMSASTLDFIGYCNKYEYRLVVQHIITLTIKNKDKAIIESLINHKLMRSNVRNIDYITLYETKDINFIKWFCSKKETKKYMLHGIINHILKHGNVCRNSKYININTLSDTEKKGWELAKRILKIFHEFGRIRYNAYNNINLRRALKQKNGEIVGLLLQHVEVIKSITTNQFKDSIKLITKNSFEELIKSGHLKHKMDMDMVIEIAHTFESTYFITFCKKLITEQLDINIKQNVNHYNDNKSDATLDALDTYSRNLLKQYLEKDMYYFDRYTLGKITNRYCLIPQHELDYMKVKLGQEIGISLF